MSGRLPAPTLRLSWSGWSVQADNKAHLFAEVVQVEQSLQVCALPLNGHVEVGQLSLEGPLCGSKGCQFRELCSFCLTGPSGCRSQLGCLLGQLQASAVLGLSGRERGSTQLPPCLRPASESGTSTAPLLNYETS